MSSIEKTKKKRRWFFKVVTETDALAAADIAAKVVYVVAALFLFGNLFGAITSPMFVEYKPGDVVSLSEPILFVFLGRSVQSKQSRTAATALVMHLLSTLVIKGFFSLDIYRFATSVPTPENIGGLIGEVLVLSFLLSFLCYIAYYTFQGSFKYHALKKTRVVWRKVLALTGITIVYAVVAFVLSLSIDILLIMEFTELEGTKAATREMGLILINLVVWLASWRLLPGTRRFAVIIPAEQPQSDLG